MALGVEGLLGAAALGAAAREADRAAGALRSDPDTLPPN
jgi:hypothetical protein